MKRTAFLITIFMLLSAACIVYVPSEQINEPYYERYSGAWEMSQVYDYLSPYGYWVQYGPYGYVWIPTGMHYNWRPYTNGRWVWTDYGWMWISNYRWGWIPFHYGRWGYDARLGWFWVPGDIWAPAWVSWRRSNLYIGWAPLPPDIPYIPGTGVVFRGRSIPSRFWIFIQVRYFVQYNIYSYVLPYERNSTIINLTVQNTSLKMRNNRIYNEGLEVSFVERVTQMPVRRYELQQKTTAGPTRLEGDRITIYNPKISKDPAVRPSKILSEREAEERIQSRFSTQRPDLREAEIERRHREEIERIEATQQREEVEMRRKMQQEEAKARSQAEKARIEREYKQRIEKLRERQEVEKKKVKERQEAEKKKVRKKKK